MVHFPGWTANLILCIFTSDEMELSSCNHDLLTALERRAGIDDSLTPAGLLNFAASIICVVISTSSALDTANLLLLYRGQPGQGRLSALHPSGLHPLQPTLPGEGSVRPQYLPPGPQLSAVLGETSQNSGSLSHLPPLLPCQRHIQTDNIQEYFREK